MTLPKKFRLGLAAKVAVQKLQGKGNVIIYTMPEQVNLVERLRGYHDVLESHPGIKIVETIDIKGDPGIAYEMGEVIEHVTDHGSFDFESRFGIDGFFFRDAEELASIDFARRGDFHVRLSAAANSAAPTRAPRARGA